MTTLQPIQNGASTAVQQSLPPTNASAAESSPPTASTAIIESTAAADAIPSTEELQSEQAPAPENAVTGLAATPLEKRWPGWPGHCVFRLIVPVVKVGSIIGRKGELVKKMCEETRARIRVLDGAAGTSDRIVLISGKEEPEALLSPAMVAAIRIFKRVSGLSETDGENLSGAAGIGFCSVRLLVASTQAINLIGKQGSIIKSIQEKTLASVRVLSRDEMPFYAAADERVVDLQGEASKVLKALEAVIGHLRKFLVDQSVLPLFEKKTYNAIPLDHQPDIMADKQLSLHSASQPRNVADIPLPTKRDSLLADRESQLDSLLPSSTMSLYGHDSSLSGLRSSALSRAGPSIVTTVIQTMQVPLSYAEDIIGLQGTNIDYVRRRSGAILTVQESRVPDEIIVEIKGTSSQVQTAQQLIQETVSKHKETVASDYSMLDAGLRPSYSQLGSSSYPSSSLTSQHYSGYGSSGLGGYSTFRL
ncbi:hypothetical protein RIF29_07354 [Crotalaria pallida]|uniref:K Homology domain-containing protein n=1 Tax=Crotalaria pallida TaxID=3830 RepID=A0AAN9PBC4_CROPI